MKTLLTTLAIISSTVLFAQQAPAKMSQTQEQWLTALNSNGLQTAMRFKGDSMIFIAYEQPGIEKVVVKIKGESGATLCRKAYRDQSKMARFDVSEFPKGKYTVNVSLPGDTTAVYSFVKE
jgi:hypothetical protein